MRVVDIDFYTILLYEKSYENILICDISYKTFRHDKIDGFIKTYDGSRTGIRIIWSWKTSCNFLIGLNIL